MPNTHQNHGYKLYLLYQTLYEIKQKILKSIAQKYQRELLDLYKKYSENTCEGSYIQGQVYRIKNRQIKNLCLGVLATLDSKEIQGIIKKQFENLVKQYPNRFIWYKESISREELAKLYNESLIYIQPSRYEAFGLCVLEAMACGKAVICSNKGGIPELVENSGEVIPLNSNLFSKKILKLLEDFRLRERYGRRAVEGAKLFDWKNIALKTLNLYKKILGEKKDN